MRAFLLMSWCLFSFGIKAYSDPSPQQAIQQAYEELVQIDAQIENLLKQKLQLKAEIAQHRQREETSLRPRVERRQNEQIENLSQQIQSLSQQISELDGKRSTILLNLQ